MTLREMQERGYPLPGLGEEGEMTCPGGFVATQPAGRSVHLVMGSQAHTYLPVRMHLGMYRHTHALIHLSDVIMLPESFEQKRQIMVQGSRRVHHPAR